MRIFMIGRHFNNLKMPSFNSILLFFIVLLLFKMVILLFSINNKIAYIYKSISMTTANTYVTLLEISNKNNTVWTKDKLDNVKNNINNLDNLIKYSK